MNSTKKLLLVAGIVLHTASTYAGDWAAAFDAFGGLEVAQAVLSPNAHGMLTVTNAIKVARNAGEANKAEAMAIARALVPVRNVNQIPASPYSDADVKEAAQALMNAVRSAAPVVQEPVIQQPTQQVPAAQEQASGGLLGGWFGNNSSQSAAPAITAADLQNAVNAQKQSDILLTTASSQALANIVSSGKSGASLYTAFIDYIFSTLQVAINSIADVNTQQQVISYIQSKFASMKAAVATNNYNARIMGRYSSEDKKGAKDSSKAKKAHDKAKKAKKTKGSQESKSQK